ncbi:MAG: hypothetical protein VKK97_03440 [Synechococcaceae cyanobacterium]|nr:hypothetical protein [Synechococcaceae cyanobacterium]
MSSREGLVERLTPSHRDEPLRLHVRNLYILPTRFGWLWLSGAGLLLLIAIQTQQNGPLLLAYLMGGLMLLALHITHFNLQGLELASAVSDAAFAGTFTDYRLELRSRLVRQSVQLRWQHASPAEAITVTVPSGVLRLALPWRPMQRGWQRPGRLMVHSTAPLGLFRCWSNWSPQTTQLIYPQRRRGPVLERIVRAEAADCSDCEVATGSVEGMDQWHDLSPHRPEDGPRRVAWKQLAQGRGRYSKQFTSSEPPPRILSAAEGVDPEQALDHLCERICMLSASDLPFGLNLPGERITPGRGTEHRERCLRALACCQP